MTTPDADPAEQLLSRLREVAQELDPVPDLVVLAAQAAFGLRTVDAQLAELVADSLDTAGAVRATTTGPRLLSYAWGDLTLELEVSEDGPGRRLLGELTGATGTLMLETTATAHEVRVDPHGRFDVHVTAGLLRVRCTAEDGTAVTTSWTRV
ncbi:MAG: hypothetical protein JWL64_888 [Frankiales bacterium]|nr:hypothetical protein [Frankiales bacterium]